MTEPEKVTVAEIAQETYALIDSLVGSLTTEQEDAIQADVVTWNLNRDDVDLEVDVDGVSLHGQRLLNAIRARVRKHLGLSLYSSEANSGGSYSVRTMHVF